MRRSFYGVLFGLRFQFFQQCLILRSIAERIKVLIISNAFPNSLKILIKCLSQTGNCLCEVPCQHPSCRQVGESTSVWFERQRVIKVSLGGVMLPETIE